MKIGQSGLKILLNTKMHKMFRQSVKMSPNLVTLVMGVVIVAMGMSYSAQKLF